jgi:ABC-type multidrug transport system fused ATPase/permease subunit
MGLSLVAINFSKQTIDIATGNPNGNLWAHAAGMIACIVGSMIAGMLNPWMIERNSMKFQMQLQMLLNGRMMAASWKSAQQWHTGDILNRLVKDCAEVVQLVVFTVPSLCVTLVELVAALVFLFILDSRIAWLILFSSPLLLLSKIYYKRMRKLSKEWKSNDSLVTSVLQENTNARLLIASLGAENVRNALLEEGLQKRLHTGMQQLKIAIYSKTILQSVFHTGYFLAFLLGIYYLSKDLITFGTMVAFIQLVGRIQGPILQFIGFVPGLIRVRA